MCTHFFFSQKAVNILYPYSFKYNTVQYRKRVFMTSQGLFYDLLGGRVILCKKNLQYVRFTGCCVMFFILPLNHKTAVSSSLILKNREQEISRHKFANVNSKKLIVVQIIMTFWQNQRI